jgi:glyoxylase-like metal-dependent hydrolase (beta-lactamase superfamily II)
MKRYTHLALLTAAIFTGCAAPAPEQQIVRDAAAALGGADALLAVNTLIIEAEGTQYNLGQDVSPSAATQTFAVAPYRRAIDVRGGRARTELVRVPRFSYWQGVAPQPQVQGIDNAIAYNVNPAGAATRLGQAAADDRRAELLRHPVMALRAALDPAARLTNQRTEAGESVVDVLTSDGRAFTLTVDPNTNLPVRVSMGANNVNLGDVSISTEFAGYENVDGLRLPTRLTTRTDSFTTAELRVTRQVVNGDAGDLSAPAAAAAAPVPAVAAPNVTVEEVSNGFWLLAGGSHHSAVVEFSDHLMLIDAPQNDARTLAVIAKARELRPGKPLTHVVNSHHHFDHSGGIRAAVAEGLTVITHQGNAAFIEDVVRRPHTRVPDALSKNPKPLAIETVGDEKIITDGSMTVELYPAPGEHSETMLMAYLPRERSLVVIDVYEPGEPVHMFARRFLTDLKKRKLRVERIVPLHNTIVPYAQLVKDAGLPRE